METYQKRKDVPKKYQFDLSDFYQNMEEFSKSLKKMQQEVEKLSIYEKKELDANTLEEYLKIYNYDDDKQTWFDKIKDIAEKLGYAREVKEYKQNPENFLGHVGDISTVIRITITGRCNTPDLYEIMQVLGKDELMKRI